MSRVVEIRVHGVGGTPAHNLLGESLPKDVVPVHESGGTGFYRRKRDPAGTVEGFVWGDLTSSKRLQALWILLLPFTLSNVAGWMIPHPRGARSPGWWKAARGLVLVLGVLLTVGYAFGTSVVLVKQVLYQWGSTWSWEWLREDPARRVWIGGALSAGVLVLIGRIARGTQRRFESHSGPIGHPSQADDVGLFQLRVGGTPRLEIDEDFDDEEFWSRPRRTRTLLKVHELAWVAGIALFTAVAAANAGLPDQTGDVPELGLRPLFGALGLLQGLLLVGLLVTLATGFDNVRRTFVTGYFRVFGPCIAFSTAIALAAALFSGLAVVVGRILESVTSDEAAISQWGPEFYLDAAFGAGTLTFLAAVVAVLVLRFWHGRRIADEIRRTNNPPLDDARPPDPPNGVPAGQVGRLGWKRAFALTIRKADLALSIPAFVFAPLASWALLSMFGVGTRPGDVGWLSWLDWVGNCITIAGLVAVIIVLGIGGVSHKNRRTIGIVWDVLTFWPRRFHPLAVRPYAEVAVPELQNRIVHHLDNGADEVIVSAHSQGSILAYAGLTQLARPKGPLVDRVRLVTYGSPLSTLHSCFFPGYFDPAGFRNLERSLSPATTADGKPLSWRNFYRLTDYIGRYVEFAPVPEAPPVDLNVEVDDPASTPPNTDPAEFEPPDALRDAWVEFAAHSNYPSEIVMKKWITAIRGDTGGNA